MIKAVIFDIDNTLLSYDDAHAWGWDALCGYAREHFSMDRETFTLCHGDMAKTVARRLDADCAALHDRTLRYQIFLEENRLPLHHAIPMTRIYWDTFLDHAAPLPGIMDCLARLKKAGIVLGIGTDMTVDYQLMKLQRLQMLEYFDFIVTSEEVNVEKPHEKLFRLCAEKAGAAPEECLFIGDNLRKDVLGAKNAGMQALWICTDPEKAAQHPEMECIHHYHRLAERLLGK